MEHAIETLEKELKLLQTPSKEHIEDDLVGDILNFRQTSDIKLALRILKQFVENSKLL